MTAPLSPPREVRAIAERLERAGFETWCVGGAVRDALLGHPGLDWDFATAATPRDVQRLFRRTVPVGVEHGTVGVLDDAGQLHEVTTFRRDVRTDGRHAVVEFGASLEEDLARRDFTINAIAYSPITGELRDPFEGRRDLERGVVRAVGVAADRMREDRLRALRAIRFASRYGFEIDGATWAAIVESAPYLGRLSAERVKQELEKTMEQVARPAAALRRWRDAGALATLVPAVAAIDDVQLAALDCLPPPVLPGRPRRRLDRLTMLFLGLGGRDAERVVKGLKFSNADAAWIGALADRWQRLGAEMARALGAAEVDDAVLRRWAAAVGRTRVAPLLRLAAALWAARREAGMAAPDARRVRSTYRRAVRIAYRDPIELADLSVDGDDLRRAGIPPGPLLGKILHALLERVIADPSLDSRERLLSLALEIRGELAPGGAATGDDTEH
ncbi:MAG: CCA tRNA nucleotidyltransferase [Gemmatimonadaceae bacterium]